jgi:NADPH-dependent curcumin reductase CurA
MTRNTTLTLRSRPQGTLQATDFELRDLPVPQPAEGQVLIRTLYGSIDPGTRILFGVEDGYMTPVAMGVPLVCMTLGQVVESRDPKYPKDALMMGFGALAEYSLITPGLNTWIVDRNLTPTLSNHISVFGPAGLTAYAGLLAGGWIKAGETLLMSTAAGSVGALAAQIARIQGAHVVGMTGGPEKCARLKNEYRLHEAIDYRGKSMKELAAAIKAAAPKGVDFYFDNVGGIQLDAALANMNWEGRMAVCGMISQYEGQPAPTMHNLFQIVAKTLMIKGFLSFTYMDQYPKMWADMAGWIKSGELVVHEDIADGLASAPNAYMKLFTGANNGKSMVKIADL